jgi:hypothetical protein
MLVDGRWVVLRPMRGADIVALSGDDAGAIFTRLAAAVIEKSWEGDVLEEEMPVLSELLKGWRAKSEENAVPPA